MKIIPRKTTATAFTIVELLIVIAIIAILASMLLPVLSAATKHAKKTQAKLECSNIANAVQEYESDYSRFPVPAEVQAMGVDEFTFGGIFQSTNGTTWTVGTTNTSTGLIYTNNGVMAILLDYTNYLNNYNPGAWTDNTNHMKNPKRNIYLSNTHPSGWDPTMAGQPVAGIGNDLVYRDPWGNPYVITMDLDEDNLAYDSFYELPAVSSVTGVAGGAGLNGLVYKTENTVSAYAFHGNVMVWSAGPDGQVASGMPATVGVNRDNVLSWQ
jgi:prepilin-type N-terminal cleavage/methylation domain-containing protein